MAQQSEHCEVDIQWHDSQNKIDFKPKVVETKFRINEKDYPDDQEFSLSCFFEEEQSTHWSQPWDIAENFKHRVKSPDPSCTLTISYDHMCNPSTISVTQSFNKSAQKTIAPEKTAIAYLELLVSEHLDLHFTATIKRHDGNKGSVECKREGCWSGTLYKLPASDITLTQTEIAIM